MKATFFSKVLTSHPVQLNLANTNLAAKFWKSIRHDKKMRQNIWLNINSLFDVREYLDRVSIDNMDLNDPNSEILYLLSIDGHACIGTIHLHAFDLSEKKVEIGYWIRLSHEGHGYITNCLKLIEQEIKRIGFKKITLNCNSKNEKSIRIATRNHFVLDNVTKNDFAEFDELRDTFHYVKYLT